MEQSHEQVSFAGARGFGKCGHRPGESGGESGVGLRSRPATAASERCAVLFQQLWQSGFGYNSYSYPGYYGYNNYANPLLTPFGLASPYRY
jgi:hypothetical protein